MQNKSNPIEIFKQVTKDYKPEQMEAIFSQAKQMGAPDEILKQFK